MPAHADLNRGSGGGTGQGVIAGGGLVAVLTRAVAGELSANEIALVVAYVAMMMAICLIACIVPTRRALRVEPTEALRAEA